MTRLQFCVLSGRLLLVLGATVVPSAARAVPDLPPVERADWFLTHRNIESYLDSACRILSGLRDQDPTNETALALWAQANFSRGNLASVRTRKLACYNRAQAIADSLRSVDDSNPDGHLWWAAARGMVGCQSGILNSIWMLPAVKHELERALQLDSTKQGTLTGLGVLYLQVPEFVGGSRAKSRYFLETAIARYPNSTDTRLWLAKLDVAQGRLDDARCQLDTLLATDRPDDTAGFVLDDAPEARRLQAQLAPDH